MRADCSPFRRLIGSPLRGSCGLYADTGCVVLIITPRTGRFLLGGLPRGQDRRQRPADNLASFAEGEPASGPLSGRGARPGTVGARLDVMPLAVREEDGVYLAGAAHQALAFLAAGRLIGSSRSASSTWYSFANKASSSTRT